MAGQFINVRVLIDTLHEVVVVPTAAVQEGPDGAFVYVVRDDNTVVLRPIKMQQQNERETVVTDGVQAQERIVTSGFGRLTDGNRVEVATDEAAGQVDPARQSTRQDDRTPKRKAQRQPAAGG